MQGAARREYRAVLPRAATPQWRAPLAPEGRVPLGPWPRCAHWQWDAPFPAGRASPQTKGDALMRLYSRDTTLVLPRKLR